MTQQKILVAACADFVVIATLLCIRILRVPLNGHLKISTHTEKRLIMNKVVEKNWDLRCPIKYKRIQIDSNYRLLFLKVCQHDRGHSQGRG